MSKLTFEALRRANASRAPRWHTSDAGMMEWTVGDWFMAMAGEVGEGADELLPLMFMAFVGKVGQLGNMAKKYRRVQEGIANKSDDPERQIDATNALSKMFDEIADVQIYLDLFALRLREVLNYPEDVGDHVERVFNRTSEKYGFPERLVDGKFMLATKGKLTLGPSGKEYDGELLQEVPPEESLSITLTSDLPADHVASMLFGAVTAEEFAADVERAKYRGSFAEAQARRVGKSPILGMPYGVEAAPAGSAEPYSELFPGVTEKPDIPTTWTQGCGKCRWCAMDMDMDPFCYNPTVRAQAGTTVGIGLNAAVRSYCGKNGKLSLFEPRN